MRRKGGKERGGKERRGGIRRWEEGGRKGIRAVIVTSSKLLCTDYSSVVSVIEFIRRDN